MNITTSNEKHNTDPLPLFIWASRHRPQFLLKGWTLNERYEVSNVLCEVRQ
jgi:hypothetical protein